MQHKSPTSPLPEPAPAGAASGDPRSNRTVQTLLDVAERLFAARGVSQVSLREIVRESGQRNPSAARYHFGTREALIVAVVERRMAAINALRHRLLDALERSGGADDLRAVMHASVRAVADQVRGTEWGAHYVQIVAELAQWPTDTPETQVDPSLMSSLGRIESMVQHCVPDLPVVVVQRRMHMVRGYIAYTLSGWIRLNGPVTAANGRAFRQQVDTLSDFLAAGLSGPAPQRRATRAQWPAASFGLNSASTATTP